MSLVTDIIGKESTFAYIFEVAIFAVLVYCSLGKWYIGVEYLSENILKAILVYIGYLVIVIEAAFVVGNLLREVGRE